MSSLEYFTVVSAGLNSIGTDYVDADTHPDSKVVYAFVEFKAREKAGTVHWLSTLTPPRGVILDPIVGRYRSEDGQLGTIVSKPVNEVQLVTPTANPYTLAYGGVPTPSIAQTADPGAVQAALETIPALTGNVYVYRVAVNERQRIVISGATGGVFPLTFNGQTTLNPLSRNANAGTIQQALQSLSTVGNEGCSVIGPVGGPWEVEFTGLLAGQDVPLISSNSAGLTPPGGNIVISTLVPGSSTAPHKVNWINALQGTDVTQLTAVGASISTQTAGNPVAGVELVAATAVLELPIDLKTGVAVPLVYDVRFSVPDGDPKKKDRVVGGFGFVAPTVGGGIIDLASVAKIPLVR